MSKKPPDHYRRRLAEQARRLRALGVMPQRATARGVSAALGSDPTADLVLERCGATALATFMRMRQRCGAGGAR